jgi:soluble lytic murein transglycosylase
MIAVATLLLALQADPTLAAAAQITELQLDGRPRDALVRVERELAARPAPARRLGMDYLRGHLLELLGEPVRAAEAFADAMSHTPQLEHYSRWRLALEQERMGHPEVAAGLVATGVAEQPESPLAAEAIRLLLRTLARGGDCQLLRGIATERLREALGRRVALARADCALRAGERDFARSLYLALLDGEARDETAREAAERLVALLPEGQGGRPAFLLGLVFHQHREWEPALRWLRAALAGGGLSTAQRHEARYAIGRSWFFRDEHARAAAAFGDLAQRAAAPEERARAFYQQGRAAELLGQWPLATTIFRLVYSTSPNGEWAAPGLLAALRLHRRTGQEEAALDLYTLLLSRREWRQQAARAGLFLAASDLVLGRHDRARTWLGQAAAAGPEDPIELAYWRGRRAEAAGERTAAVRFYVAGARADPYNPFAQAALERLAAPELADTAAAEGRRLAASRSPADLHAAWLLQPGARSGRDARRELVRRLAADPATAPFLVVAQVPAEDWPIWGRPLDRPEEKLLALGIWDQGAPAVFEHFHPANPSLAMTGSALLARAGETRRAMGMAEEVRLRAPSRVPFSVLPTAFQSLLYPLPHRDRLLAEAARREIDPHLLAAILREESSFEPRALSGASARGLAQLITPTARRLAEQIELGRIGADDLYRPEISITLGAAYLAELAREVQGGEHLAVAAYNAGAPQARLWRSYCFSNEAVEYLTKVGFQETRGYLRKVLTSREHYRRLYPVRE